MTGAWADVRGAARQHQDNLWTAAWKTLWTPRNALFTLCGLPCELLRWDATESSKRPARRPPRLWTKKNRHAATDLDTVVVMVADRVSSTSPYASAIGFSAAAVAGQTVYTAGFTAVDAEGHIVGPGDAYRQAQEALRKLGETLAEAGAGLSDVAQTRTYLVNVADWAEVGRAHGEVFADVLPAATMIVAAALLDERMLVEIEAVAVRPA